MFKIKLFSAFIFTTFLRADIPPGYYDDAEGLDGEPLRLALHNIIDDHISQSYSSLFGHFQSTDAKPDGTVWDMYSDVLGGTPPVNIELDDSTRSTPNFISPEVSDSTSLLFTLIVSDGELESEPDSVTITILNSLGLISNIVPAEFELRQPFPNPFNPTTTIQFNVPVMDTRHVVSLKVFDIAGSVVHTLVNSAMESGQYEIHWDASKHASGIYFLKMESAPSTGWRRGYVKKQKMILMK